MTVRPPWTVRYRTAILVAGILLFLPPLALLLQAVSGDHDLCGRWCPRMFFVWRQGTGAEQFLLGLLRSLFGVGLVVAVLVVTFWFGRWWCGFFCPIGGATELGSRLLPRRWQLDLSWLPAAPLRYGYLAAYLLAPALGIGSLCCNYCNFATVPRVFGAAMLQPADLAYFLRTAGLVNLGLLLALGLLTRGGRGWCNILCPVGALDALAARAGQRFGRRVRLRADHCTQCGKCTASCPTWALRLTHPPTVDQLSCIGCRQCEQACEKGAVDYGHRPGKDRHEQLVG